jgi:DNA-directed RNA polymerase subunit RPC12/RpoP
MTDENKSKVEALCPECGHAFKSYMDRVIKSQEDIEKEEKIECPVCGCGECGVGK